MIPAERFARESGSSRNTNVTVVVAKSLKALNHEEHEGHEGKEKLFLVLFVVPFFSEPFAGSAPNSSTFRNRRLLD